MSDQINKVLKNPLKSPDVDLIGRPEGRPRRERVLKDAGTPPSFRTDPAAEAGLQPVRSPVATTQPPLLAEVGKDGPAERHGQDGARARLHQGSCGLGQRRAGG